MTIQTDRKRRTGSRRSATVRTNCSRVGMGVLVVGVALYLTEIYAGYSV